MKAGLTYILVIALIILSCKVAVTQTKEDLEKQKRKALQEIKYINQLLEQTKECKNASRHNLALINEKIALRNKIITNTANQLKLIKNNIRKNESGIQTLETKLEKLKKEYAKMIYYAYKHHNSYNRLMFILAAEDFNQAYMRIRYLQQYAVYRRKQAALIVQTQDSLSKEVQALTRMKAEKNALIEKQKDEYVELAEEKKELNKNIDNIKENEKNLLARLRTQQQETKRLQAEIERIIREEAKKSAGTEDYASTPEAALLSGNFLNNRGKLPWPTGRGKITSRYGKYNHPVYPEIELNNNGIDISTTKNSVVNAVFDGVVIRVASMGGFHKVVIIRHGEYLTIYANLSNVIVNENEKVKSGQPIGTVFTDPVNNNSIIHLELWHQKEALNPEKWLVQFK